MPSYLGSNAPSKVYIGSGEVSAMYKGSTQVFSAGPPPLYTDTWTGTDGAAWPSPWSAGNGTMTIQGNAGRMVSGTGTAQARYNVTARTDQEVLVSVKPAQATSWFAVSFGSWWGDYFMANGYTMGYGGGGLTIFRTDATATPIYPAQDTSFVPVANATYKIRAQRAGSVVRFKLWVATSSEPQAWSLSYTDPSPQPAGQMQLSVYGNGAASTTTWDDLFVY